MTLLATFECISVRAGFAGDTNANNSAAIEFRVAGSATWLQAYSPVIDRRVAVNILGTPTDNSNNLNQARGSIVGLAADTLYDVRTTWTDTDGIVGGAAVTNSIMTLDYSPPTGGTTRYVDAAAGSEGDGSIGNPFKTITNAIAQSVAGDTMLVAPGRYASLVISTSGTSSAYFVLRTNGGVAAIMGGSITNSLVVAANYWVIDGFNLEQSTLGGLHINNGAHHVYVQNTLQTNAVSSSGSYCAAVELYGALHDIYLLTNNWSCWNPQITNDTDGLVNLIDLGGGPSYTVVVADNRLAGGWDGIGNRLNSGLNGNGENSDFCRNTFTNWVDDLVELDGLGPNVRFFANQAQRSIAGPGGYGGSLISDCGTYIGPSYIFRNYLRGFYTNAAGGNLGGGVGVKMGGHSSEGAAFYFHNTMVTASSGGAHELISEGGGGGVNDSRNKVFRNNIFKVAGNVYYVGGSTNDHDYNLGYTSFGAYYASSWNGTTDYETLALFQSGTVQETHGVGLDPLLNSDLTIPSNSPAVNAGAALPNFNDQNSAWPFKRNAPDIGAFEYPAQNANVTTLNNGTLIITGQ